MDLRAVQQPLKSRYEATPGSAVVRLVARGSSDDETPLSCSVDIGRAVYAAQAHAGVGGAGTAACSGDLLLGALAACAQLTCQMVAANMGLAVTSVAVTVAGDLDLRGTLGVSREAPVGFAAIRTEFDIVAPTASDDEIAALKRKTEQYCVVLRTLRDTRELTTAWHVSAP